MKKIQCFLDIFSTFFFGNCLSPSDVQLLMEKTRVRYSDVFFSIVVSAFYVKNMVENEQEKEKMKKIYYLIIQLLLFIVHILFVFCENTLENELEKEKSLVKQCEKLRRFANF